MANELHRPQAMTTQLKEIIFYTNTRTPQYVLPQLHQLFFRTRAGRYILHAC